MNYVRLRKLTTNYSFESCITKIKSIFAETLNSWNGVVLNVRERIQVKTSLLDQPLVAIRLSWYGFVLLQAFYIGRSGPNDRKLDSSNEVLWVYIEGNWGGAEFIFPIDFGIYLSIITPSMSIQSTGFHTTQTYTPSNDGCFHKLSLFLQKYMNYLASSQ